MLKNTQTYNQENITPMIVSIKEMMKENAQMIALTLENLPTHLEINLMDK
jgi:hypothetical protein